MKKNIKTVIIIGVVMLASLQSFAQDSNAFLNPPQLIKDPAFTERHTPEKRQFTGIPSLAVSPEGRLWATWYAGITPKEDQNNYVVVATSGDQGKTWEEVLAIDPDIDGPVRAYDPEIWIDPDGKLRVFWAQAIGHSGTISGVWCLTAKNPEVAQPKWSKPQRLTDGIMMCKPMVLSTGEWVLPVSTWRETDESAKMVVSTNHGKSWKVRGASNVPKDVRTYDEHIIIEKKDQSLWLLARTSYGIGESISTDRGHTWSELSPTDIAHPSARFFIRRLASGNLLLVKHGPIDKQTDRSQLTAYISKDDGKTWSDGLLLDERKGISYPDGQQVEDSTIYIIYDYNRTKEQHILMTHFTEEDILSQGPGSTSTPERTVVNDAGE